MENIGAIVVLVVSVIIGLCAAAGGGTRSIRGQDKYETKEEYEDYKSSVPYDTGCGAKLVVFVIVTVFVAFLGFKLLSFLKGSSNGEGGKASTVETPAKN